jgi:glycosyltransferase involved in cell wall biosynthesis
MSHSNHIQAITYYDPDGYPPIINSARLLSQHGFALDLFCRDTEIRWGVSYPPTVNVERIKSRGQGSWQEYLMFVKAVLGRASKRAGLFIGHDTYGFFPARLLASRYHRPLVYHCHDFVDRQRPLHLGGRFLRAFEQCLARTADLVIVPDAERGAVIARTLHLKQPPLIVANAPLTRPATTADTLQTSLSLQGVTFERIVFRQGRIGPGHAIEATLRSIPNWASKKWGFVIMGVGEPVYLEQLSAMAQMLGVSRQFVILPPVGYDQVAKFTAGANVGHALYEPLHINNVYITTASCKTMEYMAAGLPLLVSDTPASRALVKQYGCGITADHSQPESIATAINYLLGNPVLAQQMGAAAAQAFERTFSYERQFAPVLDMLRILLDCSQG